jgi:allantoinase
MTAEGTRMSDSQPYDLVLTGDVVLSDRVVEGGYVAVRGEAVAAIGAGAPPPAKQVAKHDGKLILPGLVDGHMHTSSSTGWPGIEGATMSAAAGGVTTVCDMPYDVPNPVTSAALFREKVEFVERLSHVDMALYGTIRKDGGLDEIAGIAEAGASAFKVSTYEYDAHRFPRIDHPTMLAAFAEIATTGLMVAVHNEDQELVVKLTEAAKAAGHTSPIWHCRTRPPITETMADLEIFEMALENGAHVHIAHSSLARGFELAQAVPRPGCEDLGRGLHPVSLHDGGGHRPPAGLREVQPALPQRGRGGEDVGAVGQGHRGLRLDRPRALAAAAQGVLRATSSPSARG